MPKSDIWTNVRMESKPGTSTPYPVAPPIRVQKEKFVEITTSTFYPDFTGNLRETWNFLRFLQISPLVQVLNQPYLFETSNYFFITSEKSASFKTAMFHFHSMSPCNHDFVLLSVVLLSP